MSHYSHKRSRRRRTFRAVKIIGILLCLAALSGIGTVTVARYVGSGESGFFLIRPENFYFISDVLEAGGSGNVTRLYNWDKSQDYVFFMDLRNWADDFRVTPEDIHYTVTVEADGVSNIGQTVLNENGNPVDNSGGSYTISGGFAKTQKLVITLPAGQTPQNQKMSVSVKAKPSNGKGYTRTLKGTFQLEEGVQAYKAAVETHNTYIDLLIGVDKSQEIGVTWPSWLTPDNTNTWMTDAIGNSCSVTLQDESSCRLRFFITGEKKVSDKFTVTAAGGTPEDVLVFQ